MSSLKNYTTRTNHDVGRKEDPKFVRNNAGGYVFEVSDKERLERILILGSEKNTFYVLSDQVTAESGEFIIDLALRDGAMLVDTIVDVSINGRAAKNNYALFALALAASSKNADTRVYALENLNKVARTFTHLALFLTYAQNHRGWGKALRRAVAHWYLDKSPETVTYQVAKYRNREGWTHKDVIAKSHVHTDDPQLIALFQWAHHGKVSDDLPQTIKDLIEAHEYPENAVEIVLRKTSQLSWEMLPTSVLNDPKTWVALIQAEALPIGALIRQLRRFITLELDSNEFVDSYVRRILTNAEALKRGRVHPLQLLTVYGALQNGSRMHKWVDVVQEAFTLSLGNVERIPGLRIMHGVDVSLSMTVPITSTVMSYQAAIALTQVVQTMASNNYVYAFSDKAVPADRIISPCRPIADVWLNAAATFRFGSTNAGKLIEQALENDIEVDAFIIYTDCENWQGGHVWKLMEMYREKTGINAKVIGVCTENNAWSMFDVEDPLSFNLVGFDASIMKSVEYALKA